MTTTVATITSRAATTLHDLGYVRWTQPELVDYINEGQLETVRVFPDAYRRTVQLQLVTGVSQATPTDFVAGLDVVANVDGPVVLVCDKKALDAFDLDWRTRTVNQPVKHFMFDPLTPAEFLVYPAQGTAPAQVEVNYGARPPTVTANDNIGVLDKYATNLLNYVLFRAISKDNEAANNAQIAASYYALFRGGATQGA